MDEHKRSSGRWTRPSGELAAVLPAIPAEILSAAELTAVPVIGVNLVAFYGQFTYFHSLQQIPFLMQVIMAASLESIAVYLAWQAHRARLKRDSAFRLRVGAYAAGLGIGALNYWHFCGPGWKPTPLAIVFALASVISPALWGVYSNRVSRDDLKADDLIEDHAVRLGFTRWFWHPLKCMMVQSRAAWAGENRPAAAIALYEEYKAEHRASRAERQRNRGGDQAPATTKTPPPAQSPRREPPPRPVRRVPEAGAARTGELAAASARDLAEISGREHAVALTLIARGGPLPSQRKLADDPDAAFPGGITARRNAAKRVLALAAAQSNGHGHGDDD
jgi:hypothetical protein